MKALAMLSLISLAGCVGQQNDNYQLFTQLENQELVLWSNANSATKVQCNLLSDYLIPQPQVTAYAECRKDIVDGAVIVKSAYPAMANQLNQRMYISATDYGTGRISKDDWVAEDATAIKDYKNQLDLITLNLLAAIRPSYSSVESSYQASSQSYGSEGTKVYSSNECIGPIIMGECKGSTIDTGAYHPTCHGTMLNGQCTGPML